MSTVHSQASYGNPKKFMVDTKDGREGRQGGLIWGNNPAQVEYSAFIINPLHKH
ncbi:hypothetical protein PLAN_120342 [Planktothrix rubescens CCAP 1459/22]|uniref:Uncharacterized protein n=1 Tax=Planktothrix rubescens CCAP 1459/22 TaxID=329571 RepID=A0A6J7ZHW4_PLARU|nr:hypothetical protein PLAN_120342 [Planktothrix rubescens NIVA-CYA 18]